MTEDLYIDYKGWRWREPFHCMHCGIVVSPQQWAFSRCCGGCDTGYSHTARLHPCGWKIFAGPHELIDPNDSHFLHEERFVSPEDVEKYPVLNPLPPNPFYQYIEPVLKEVKEDEQSQT